MIIILKQNANPEKVEILKQELEHKGERTLTPNWLRT